MPKVHRKHLAVDASAIDVHRHVNNQEYLRWMQEVAIEHSTAQGWPLERYLESGGSWYVRSHFIEYLRPALLADEIVICTWVASMGERTSMRKTLFLRPADQQIVARAETQWTFIDIRRGRPVRIPEDVSSAFEVVDSEADVLALVGWPGSQPPR